LNKWGPRCGDHDKEITKLKWELRDIDVAIADFERLEAKSSSVGRAIKTPKSSNLIHLKRRPGKRIRNNLASVIIFTQQAMTVADAEPSPLRRSASLLPAPARRLAGAGNGSTSSR
jgi:hypothetical protein